MRTNKKSSIIDHFCYVIGLLVIFFIGYSGIIYQNSNNFVETEYESKIDTLEDIYSKKLEQKNELDSKVLEMRKKTEIKQLYVDVIKEYFASLGDVGALTNTEELFVHYAIKKGIDYKRSTSISLHETYAHKDEGYGIGYGRSKAIKAQYNVAGINLTTTQRNLMNVKGYKANLIAYRDIEESIVAQACILRDYIDWWGFDTLSEIQNKYAPEDDDRNGWNGMDNSVWYECTSKHYYALQKIENRLMEERGLIQ